VFISVSTYEYTLIYIFIYLNVLLVVRVQLTTLCQLDVLFLVNSCDCEQKIVKNIEKDVALGHSSPHANS
jgi:hypothetical protein